jgi:hypothetical protein
LVGVAGKDCLTLLGLHFGLLGGFGGKLRVHGTVRGPAAISNPACVRQLWHVHHKLTGGLSIVERLVDRSGL